MINVYAVTTQYHYLLLSVINIILLQIKIETNGRNITQILSMKNMVANAIIVKKR